MFRTQIQLTNEQARALKKMAQEKNVSVAAIIRESVDEVLRSQGAVSRDEQIQRALAVVGRFHSGKHDISVHHDDYLAEAYGERK
ncbi:MAG: ribbon-helix-helix domain-containing protein [Thermoleophilia bacterium]